MNRSMIKVVCLISTLVLLMGMLGNIALATTAQTGVIGQNVQFDPNKEVSGKLTVWFYEDGRRFVDELFQDYKKYRPNVELEVTYIPWADYWKKLPLAISGGTGPDLFYFHNMYDNLMVGGGQLDAYPQDLVNNLAMDYSNVSQFDQNGKTYYIGVGGGHGVIYYNKAMWAAAGLTDADIPTTWEQLRTVAAKLTQWDGDKMSVSGYNNNGNWGPFANNEVQLLSGNFIYSEDGKQVLFDNDGYKSTLKFFIDLYNVDKVCTSTFPDAIQSFQDGTTAMMWQHPWFSGMLKSTKPDLDFGVYAVPKFEGKARNWHYNNPDVSMGINSQTTAEGKALAADLLTLFFADDKYMKSWDLAQGLAPTKNSLQADADLLADPNIKVVMQDYDNSCYLGTGPQKLGDDVVQNIIQPILLNNVDIDTAVKAGVDVCNATLADYEFIPAERKWSHADELK